MLPRGPFERAFIMASVGLALLTIVVALRGDRTELRPIATTPADGEAGISTRPLITVQYRAPIDPDSAGSQIHLSPAVDGTVEVAGDLIRFAPRNALKPETTYQLRIAAGLRDRSGRASTRDVVVGFETRAPRLLVSRPDISTRAGGGVRNLWAVGWDGLDERLTDEPLGVLAVSVAPDGERLVYSSSDPVQPTTGLWSARVDGAELRQLVGEAQLQIGAHSWSPRGDLIVYDERTIQPSGRVSPPRLMAMQPDGTRIGPLYGRDREAGAQPSFSPDGTRLAFYETTRRSLGIFNFTDDVRFFPMAGLDVGGWSPDGSHLVYSRPPDESAPQQAVRPPPDRGQRPTVAQRPLPEPVLWVLDLTSEHERQVSPPGFRAYSSAWSPDGRTIAFIGRDPTEQSGCWLLDLESATARLVLDGPESLFSRPVFSPDGLQLAVSRLEAPPRSNWQLWLGAADGSELRRSPFDGQIEAWLP